MASCHCLTPWDDPTLALLLLLYHSLHPFSSSLASFTPSVTLLFKDPWHHYSTAGWHFIHYHVKSFLVPRLLVRLPLLTQCLSACIPPLWKFSYCESPLTVKALESQLSHARLCFLHNRCFSWQTRNQKWGQTNGTKEALAKWWGTPLLITIYRGYSYAL